MRKIWWMAGGVVVAAGVGWWLVQSAHRFPAASAAHSVNTSHSSAALKETTKTQTTTQTTTSPTPTIPSYAPVPPTAHTASGSADASFAAATGQPASTPLEVVSLPWAPTTQWAIDPIATHQNGDPNGTLWFGERTGSGSWHWIPSTLPGALSHTLPKPVYDALQLAWDLNQGQPGPQLLGTITWNGITGQVGMPAGWTLESTSATGSPLAAPSVLLTVWEPSHYGEFHGLYGVQTAWDAQNAPSGTHGLVGLVANPGPMSAIAANPPQ